MTDRVDHLASLAGIDLSGEERERLRAQLEALQSLVDALPESAGEAPRCRRPPVALRDDETSPPLPLDAVTGLMPARRGSWLDVAPVREDPS